MTTHPFIEAMAKTILDTYNYNAMEALEAIGFALPDTFTQDDVHEVLQRLRSASTGGVQCFYCGAVIEPVAAGRADILAHSKVCPEHPCRALEQEIAQIRHERDAVDANLDRLRHVLCWAVMEQHQGAYHDVGQWLRLALWAMDKGKRVPLPPMPFGDYNMPRDPDDAVIAWSAEHDWEEPLATVPDSMVKAFGDLLEFVEAVCLEQAAEASDEERHRHLTRAAAIRDIAVVGKDRLGVDLVWWPCEANGNRPNAAWSALAERTRPHGGRSR